jgi:hypothetical protein
MFCHGRFDQHAEAWGKSAEWRGTSITESAHPRPALISQLNETSIACFFGSAIRQMRKSSSSDKENIVKGRFYLIT